MKRQNKTKDQLLREMQQIEKQKAHIDKEKFIARTVFPFAANLKTIYDAQTAFNAASGYIQLALVAKEATVKVSDLDLKTNPGKDEVSIAVDKMIESVKDVTAKDVADLLQRMGQKLPEYVANIHLKDPMTIKSEDFIA